MKINLKTVSASLCAAGAILILLIMPESLPPAQARAAALALLTIGFWATGVLPEHITSLLFFLLAMLLAVAPARIVFAGFSSAAVWLVFGGLVIGIGIMSTGLGKRTAEWTADRLHGSYLRIITGLVSAGVLFSFIMPAAMGRVVLLTPIAVSIAEHFGFREGSKGRTGVLLAVIAGTFIPAFGILPGNVPNMVLAGLAESQFDTSLLYGSYLLLHFPILSLVKGVLLIGLILWMFPDVPMEKKNEQPRAAVPWNNKERILAGTLAVMLFLWMTDFMHHISPAWIALGGAVFLLFPGIEIVGRQQFNQKINWASLVFISGILGLGGMISYTGLGTVLAGKLIEMLPLGPGRQFADFVSVSLAAALTGIATTLPGIPAVFTPLSKTISLAADLPVESILMMQVVGFSTVFLPYQAPPIVIGMQLSGEKFSSAARLCLALAGLTILFLLPLDFFWWRLLGWL